MAKKKDLTGQQFGTLTAIRPTEERDCRLCVIWECRCSNCGRTVFLSTYGLKAPGRRHCKCVPKRLRTKPTELTNIQKEIVLAFADGLYQAQVARRVNTVSPNVAYHSREIKVKTGKDPRFAADLPELVKMVKGE